MNFNPVEREWYRVNGDTECWRNGDGYDRTLILNSWDPDDSRRIARIQIRVDRFPRNSYAHIGVWVSEAGWQYVTSLPPHGWWDKMPGYLRGQTMESDRQTMTLVDELVLGLLESQV